MTNKITYNYIQYQDSEIARLKTELSSKSDYIHKQQEIIDNLKDKYNRKGLTVNITFNEQKLSEIVQDCIKDYELQINNIRAEAIKEFAEELKKRVTKMSLSCCGNLKHRTIIYQFSPDTIDNLIKEMTEVNND